MASYLPDEKEVYERLMNNGSRLRPSKRGTQKVSVNNRTQLYKDEPKGVHKLNEREHAEFNNRFNWLQLVRYMSNRFSKNNTKKNKHNRRKIASI